MYQRILVPLDGSPLAEQVIPYLYGMIKGLNCPIMLLRVYTVPPLVMEGTGSYIDEITSRVRQEAEEYLNRVSSSLGNLGVPVSVAVGEGQAASMIVDQAEQAEGTLIAMCTHGRSGISRWVLGSVAEKVLNATNNPLLVIRARPLESDSPDAVSTHSERWATTVTIKAVTVPLDGSSVSEQILSHAKSIAKSLDVPVTLVGVATPDSSEAEVAGYLDTAANTLRQDGVSSNETQLLHGDPADAILDMLQQSPDCLVAMTTRGRSGVKRWTMGSVTDRVVRYSGAPVLVVRGV